MTTATCDITHPKAQEYAEAHSTPEQPPLRELNRWAHLNTAQPRMIAGAYQGRLLQMLSQMVRPHRAVELGSYVGYSTVCLAQGLADDGVLHAIEADEECEDIIRHALAAARVGEKVRLHIGPALEVIPTIDERYDLAFIDADKRNTPRYYDMLVPRMNIGGFIVIDNVLWSGKVLSDVSASDKDTLLFCEFNDYVQHDRRVENLLLPIRDGLMLARVVSRS